MTLLDSETKVTPRQQPVKLDSLEK
jgi:hypothetical protein